MKNLVDLSQSDYLQEDNGKSSGPLAFDCIASQR